jgi:hypothetical protein
VVETDTYPAETIEADCGGVQPFGIVRRTVPSSSTSVAVYVTAHKPLDPATTLPEGEIAAFPLPGPAHADATHTSATHAASAAIRVRRESIMSSKFLSADRGVRMVPWKGKSRLYIHEQLPCPEC